MSLPPHGWHAEHPEIERPVKLPEWVNLWWLLTNQPLERPIDLSLDPHDELDIRVGNALRIALNRFDKRIHQHRPYTLFDEVMEDLQALYLPEGPTWMDLR